MSKEGTKQVRRAAKPTTGITALGKRVTKFQRLETFPKPSGLDFVELVSDEVTANCPVTGQPDFYTVTIIYCPEKLCVESKTVKLFLQSYRNKGLFCEAFSAEIAKTFAEALQTEVTVEVKQTPRGGVGIKATSTMAPDGMEVFGR